MSKAFKARSTVAYHAKRSEIISLAGTRHPFKVGDKKARKAAVEAAQDAGEQHLATMQKQKGDGATLSKTEQTTGRFDPIADEPGEPHSLRKEPGEKRNPYRVAADSEAARPAHTPTELGKRNSRVAHFNRLADQYERTEAAKEIESQHWASEPVRAMTDHATNLVTSISADPQSTPAMVAQAQHLHRLATRTILSPDAYHAMVANAGLTKPPPSAGKHVGVAGDVAGKFAAGDYNVPGTETPANE